MQLTKISPPFRISICISTIIPSLIFHGTGCSCYRFSNDVSQVFIELPPPPHIHGLLQKYSNHIPLLVWDGPLSVNFTLRCYSFRCGKKQNENQCSKNNVRNFDLALPTRRGKSNCWHGVVKRGGKCGPGSGADLDLNFESRFWKRLPIGSQPSTAAPRGSATCSCSIGLSRCDYHSPCVSWLVFYTTFQSPNFYHSSISIFDSRKQNVYIDYDIKNKMKIDTSISSQVVENDRPTSNVYIVVLCPETNDNATPHSSTLNSWYWQLVYVLGTGMVSVFFFDFFWVFY